MTTERKKVVSSKYLAFASPSARGTHRLMGVFGCSACHVCRRSLFQRKKSDVVKLQQLVKTHRPHLIVLAATSLECRDIRKEIEDALTDCRVGYALPDVGRIFMESERGKKEFRDYPPLLRQAISVGRRVLDPLAELSALWYQDSVQHTYDIQALSLHPLQDRVPLSMLLRALSRTFMEVINAVGVDINRIVHRPFLAAPLQFVCGLGARKSKQLLTDLARKGFISSRRELSNYLGPVVARNCAGFIKVSTASSQVDTGKAIINPLDESRVHPEHYHLARTIMCEALGTCFPVAPSLLRSLSPTHSARVVFELNRSGRGRL